MDPNSIVASVIRTLVPITAGFIVAMLAKAGLHIDSETGAMAAVAVLSGLWYLIGRFAEPMVPLIGRIMLSMGLVKSAPVYVKTEAAAEAARRADSETGALR